VCKGCPIVLAFVFAGTACGGRAASIVDAGHESSSTGSGASSDAEASSAVDAGTSDGGLAVPPSCLPGGPGLTNCGANSESCCTSLEVAGGTYYRTYDVDAFGNPSLPADGGATGLADPATVSGFRLDKYLVTVGRFRQFVAAWNGGAGYTPPAGSGKHTHLNGGNGLNATAGGYEPGWVATDDAYVAPTDVNLTGAQTFGSTWTASPGTQETLPITCVNWYEAYAFCIWDGGFLPSEAEWEYAAAGGSQQREYPWGSTDPGTSNQYAIYGDELGNCYYPSGGVCTGVANIAPVGTATLGAGLWGQLDLAGEIWEWNLDWYAAYVDPCTDCAATTNLSNLPDWGTPRVIKGGGSGPGSTYLSSPYRGDDPAALPGWGLRCARTP
jgi:formylglycine-generating enzyme